MGLSEVGHSLYKLIDRNGKESSPAADPKHIGDRTTWICYHLDSTKADHIPALGPDKKRRVPALDQLENICAIQKRVVFTRLGNVRFDGRPDIRHKPDRDSIDSH